MEDDRGRIFRNNYKGHMDKKPRRDWDQGREVGMAGVGGVVGGNADSCS